jgi:hypothetical protein
MKGRIQGIYPEGGSSVYNYICAGEGGLFSFPVKRRYHIQIVENAGIPIGRWLNMKKISPPSIRFLN